MAGRRDARREGEWLATGDLAERNAAGDLRFLGRKGDVIVTGAGMNIHPADVEAALRHSLVFARGGRTLRSGRGD